MHFVHVTNLNRRIVCTGWTATIIRSIIGEGGPNLPNFEPRFGLIPVYQASCLSLVACSRGGNNESHRLSREKCSCRATETASKNIKDREDNLKSR